MTSPKTYQRQVLTRLRHNFVEVELCVHAAVLQTTVSSTPPTKLIALKAEGHERASERKARPMDHVSAQYDEYARCNDL